MTALDIQWREPFVVNTSLDAHTSAQAEAGPSSRVILLVTSGCHFCEDARAELTARADRGELELTVVSVDSEQGAGLQATHRPSMFPLVLLDGQPFSVGRLPRRKLDRALTRTGTR